MKKTNSNKGFTLIELLVVISIISLLSTIVLASLNGAREKAQSAAITQSVRSLTIALALTYDGGNYPTFGGSLVCLSETCTIGGTSFARNAALEAALLAQLPESEDKTFALSSLLAKTAHAQSIDLENLPPTPTISALGGTYEGIFYLGTNGGNSANVYYTTLEECSEGFVGAPGTGGNVCGLPVAGGVVEEISGSSS